MSEQVKRYDGQMMLGGTAIAAGFKTGMVTGRDYDALHAEAEARLEREQIALVHAMDAAHESHRLRQELEAARGLLRDMRLGQSPADVIAVVNAARKVITWLDWSGGLPCVGGESMTVDVQALSAAAAEFEEEELLRQAAAITGTETDHFGTYMLVAEAAIKHGRGRDRAVPADECREVVQSVLTATPAPEVRHALSAENQRVVPPGPIIAPPHPFDKPSLLKECNVTYSNSSRPLAEQGERQEAVTMRDVMQALESVPGAPALTSNMCHAIAQHLNANRQAQRK